MDIYEILKQEILNGTIPLGSRLPEIKLAERFESSRTPIREALRRLEADGLVVSLPNKGAHVREYTIENIKNNFDLRALLEGFAAALAATHRTEAQLAKLQESLQKSDKGLQLYEQDRIDEGIAMLVEANNEFHMLIIQMSQNDEIAKMLSTLITLPLIYRGFYWFDLDGIESSILHHKLIAKAIEAKDTFAAESYMKAHLYKGRDNVLKNIQAT